MIIGNVKYEQHGLNAKGKAKFDDLPNVEENVKTARETVKFLGIKDVYKGERLDEKNVYVLTDCTKQDVEKAIQDIRGEFNLANTNDRDKILLFVFYAGHG